MDIDKQNSDSQQPSSISNNQQENKEPDLPKKKSVSFPQDIIENSNSDEEIDLEYSNEDSEIKLGEASNSSTSFSSFISESSDLFSIERSSYFNIINYIFKLNNKNPIDSLIDFGNGLILPNFVEILLKKKVPNTIKSPLGYDQIMNNINALCFISQNGCNIEPQNLDMSVEKDIIYLIRILLKKYILTSEIVCGLKESCNDILYLYKKSINNFNIDWENGINFAFLLDFIKQSIVQFQPDENLDINILHKTFNDVECPCIIENDSIFGNIDEAVIQYQVKIIIDEIQKRKITIQKRPQTENHEKIVIREKNDFDPLLRILNEIGKEFDVHYDSLDDIIKCIPFYRLVKHLMNVSSIPGFDEENPSDIKPILNFITEQNSNFMYMSFNFENESKKYINIKLLVSALLNNYFLKDSQTEMIEKASQFLGEQIKIEKLKHTFLFGRGFYKILGNNDDHTNKNYYDEASLLALFKEKNIPFILDEESLTNINEDFIFYQLQLIFDSLCSKNDTKKEKMFDIHQILESNYRAIIDLNKQKSSNNSPIIDKIKQILKKTNNEEEEEEEELEFLTKTLKRKNSLKDIKSALSNLKKSKYSEKEEKFNSNAEPEYIFTNKLYSYEFPNQNQNELNEQLINEELEELFKKIIPENIRSNENENKLDKSLPNNTNSLKSFKIFEYKSEKWNYNESNWSDFITKNNINSTDILYWILLPPSPIISANIKNDPTYRLVNSIASTNEVESEITNDFYVEILLCGKIADIRKKLGFNAIQSTNEYLAFIQLRYPDGVNAKIPAVVNMQSALTLQANYIVSMHPTTSINDSAYFINTSMHNASQSFYFNSKFIQMSFLLNSYPSKSFDKSLFDESYLIKLYKILDNNNNKIEFFKDIRKYYEYTIPKIYWIDLNDSKTYKYFIERIIKFCQNHTQDLSRVNSINLFLSKVCDINLIHDQKEMINFMDRISRYFRSLENPQIFHPILSYNPNKPEQIDFNQNEWSKFNNFIQSNESLFFIITFINSNPDDINLIAKIFSGKEVANSFSLLNYQAQFIHCEKSINDKEIILINLITPITCASDKSDKNENHQIEIDKIFFEVALASISNVIITIADPKRYDYQLCHYNKLMTFLKPNPGINYYFVFLKDRERKNDNVLSIFLNYYDNCDNFKNSILHNSKNNLYVYIRNYLAKISKASNDYLSNISKALNDYFANISKNTMKYFDIIIKYFTAENPTKIIELPAKEVLACYYYKTNKNIDTDFGPLITKIGLKCKKDNKLFKSLMELRKMVKSEYAKYANARLIEQVKEHKILSNFACKYITDRVTIIDENDAVIIKNSCKEKIKDDVYKTVLEYCNEHKKSNVLALYTYKELINNELSKEIDKFMNDIDECISNKKQFKHEEIKTDKEKLEQNSMRYKLVCKFPYNSNF